METGSNPVASIDVRKERELDRKLDFGDVAIVPRINNARSRSEVNLHVNYTFKHSGQKFTGVPIMNANMDTTGTLEMVPPFVAYGILPTLHKHYSVQTLLDHVITLNSTDWVYSLGMREEDTEKLLNVVDFLRIKYLMVDVANGYSREFHSYIRHLREVFPSVTIIAGNVVTPEGVAAILDSGADVVKVGIASGSACATKNKTGVFYPQFSAVMECAEEAEKRNGHIVSDGGTREPGHFAKAFAAGAHFVMAGGMFAGHAESAGREIVHEDGKTYKEFYGMSSTKAMQKYQGVEGYRTSEGHEQLVPYKGRVENTIQDILGGIRSACTYVNAMRLEELPLQADFIRIS